MRHCLNDLNHLDDSYSHRQIGQDISHHPLSDGDASVPPQVMPVAATSVLSAVANTIHSNPI